VSSDEAQVRDVITKCIAQMNKSTDDLSDETGLFGDGLELDSLEIAELSATLEDELGTDPFSGGDSQPQTIGEVLAFYQTDPVG
jgi:acyl carrier protein